jgi:ATP-dependent phosphofructokinase / diphosphate-dependent phosphofructokinase
VVEVLGAQAGWLALQAGIAVCADAVLIPEIPGDLQMVAARLKEKVMPRRPYGLVVVAEGAKILDKPQAQAAKTSATSLKATLSRWPQVKPVSTSFSGRARQPRWWRRSCSC